jgi:murein DD-endopeptidase MepM/ murein hydrolase activator NlpD
LKTLSYSALVLLAWVGAILPGLAQQSPSVPKAAPGPGWVEFKSLPHRGQGEGLLEDHAHDQPQCLSDVEHEAIRQENIANMAMLEKAGLLKPVDQVQAEAIVGLGWPLRQAAGFSDPSYFFISNFVDHNPATGAVLDYNCGTRTYDGHKGLDIAIFPFRWNKVATGQVEVVAAAAGVIINKFNGNFDLNCTFTGQWNAVYVRHADGSVAWYGHMKNGSLTTKAIGQTVAKGEYLGVVASSGWSTGPHLHFELYADPAQTQLRDPFGGPCNSINGTTSWWDAQRPYHDPAVLAIMTHSAQPVQNLNACPANSDVVNASSNFMPGNTVWYSASFRQIPAGAQPVFRIVQPNGAVWHSWNITAANSFLWAWWNWNFTLPTNAMTGVWQFQTTFNGQTFSRTFNVGNTACGVPGGLSTSNITQTAAKFNWAAVPGAQSYSLETRLGSGAWTAVTGGPWTTTSVTVSGFQANSAYQWRVRSNCAGGVTSAWSAGVGFSTLGNTTGCGAPVNLQASQIGQTSALLSWSAVAGATGYFVQLNTTGVWMSVNTTPATGTTFTLYGLFANRTYQWRVLPVCGGTQGTPSAAASFSTATAPNCSLSGTQFPETALTPTTAWKFQPDVWGGEYCVVNVTAGTWYTFSYCPIDGGAMPFDGEISLRTTFNQLIAYADDVCGAAPRIVWQAGFTGQVRVLLTRYSCQPQNTSATMAYRIGATSASDLAADGNASAGTAIEPVGDESVAGEPAVEARSETPAATLAGALLVYPNPASGAFSIRFENEVEQARVHVEIYDRLGRRMWRQSEATPAGTTEWTVPVQDWTPGLYFVRLRTADGNGLEQRVHVN